MACFSSWLAGWLMCVAEADGRQAVTLRPAELLLRSPSPTRTAQLMPAHSSPCSSLIASFDSSPCPRFSLPSSACLLQRRRTLMRRSPSRMSLRPARSDGSDGNSMAALTGRVCAAWYTFCCSVPRRLPLQPSSPRSRLPPAHPSHLLPAALCCSILVLVVFARCAGNNTMCQCVDANGEKAGRGEIV